MHRAIVGVLAATLPTAFVAAQASWAQLYPGVSPPPRNDAAMACYEATGEVLMLFGNPTGSGPFRLQGDVWSPLVGAQPSARDSSRMVYDSVRQRLVMFGGWVGGVWLQDTWEYDGANWLQRAPANRPSPRAWYAIAFDRVRGVTVLFGGQGIVGMNLPDLWEWDGTSWTQRTAPLEPAPRSGAVMAFDPVRRSVLLHGGSSFATSTVVFNDTWSWDGVSWQQRFPATPPTFRQAMAAVTDLHRQRVVLHGGMLADSYAWEWDGSEWSLRVQASPSARAGHTMAYDTLRRRTVLFGGSAISGSGVILNDTWVYRTPTPADVVLFGAGCAGTAGVPQLANAPYSYPWIGDTLTNRVRNLAPAAGGVVFATGFQSTAPISLASYGMPGCDQLVIPATTEFGVATAGGAEWTLAIPNTTALANVHLFQQVFALDAAANALGLTASNGVEITTGIR